jgi:hypothetical protein
MLYLYIQDIIPRTLNEGFKVESKWGHKPYVLLIQNFANLIFIVFVTLSGHYSAVLDEIHSLIA